MMTKDDQDAEVGRLVRERRDLRAEYEALMARSQKVGSLLSSIGHILSLKDQHGHLRLGAPAILKFGDGGTVNVTDQYRQHEVLSGKFPTADELAQLRADIQATSERLSRLDQHLTAFGV